MIVAKDTLGTINTHVISGHFKINIIQTTKMFTLKTISKSNTSFVYHIEVKVADETYFVEMRKHKLTSHKIYLHCSSKKCNAKINIIVKPEIPIEKVSKYVYKFGANTTDEMMLNINNYGEIVHNHRPVFKSKKENIPNFWIIYSNITNP